MTRIERHVWVALSFGRLWAAARHTAPRLPSHQRLLLAAALARQTLDALDIRLVVHGPADPAQGPLLVASNHVSWLDVYALNALYPARFVAKSETSSWPIVGTITRAFDSIFIVRGSVRDAYRVKNRIRNALAAGEQVVAFPEATTTDGGSVLRFHPALFQAAIDVGASVQPVAIRYLDERGQRTTAPAFVGDMTFVESFRRVTRAGRMTIEVQRGEVLTTTGIVDRRALAESARSFVIGALGMPAPETSTSRLRDRSLPSRGRGQLRLAFAR